MRTSTFRLNNLSPFSMSRLPKPANKDESSAQPDHSKTLASLEQTSWEQLILATSHKKERSNFKMMTLATCTPRGADARTVVLRRVNQTHKYVWFYTDARAEKVLQLEGFPLATLLLWDNKSRVQLRLKVETRLHTDDYIAYEHWQDVTAPERKLYLSEPIPGSSVPEPYPGYPDHLGEALPSKEESAVARTNFAVIECRVLVMEYLNLSPQGQKRACFQYEPESKQTWLAP